MNKIFSIIVPSAQIFKQPKKHSEITSEALYGEDIELLRSEGAYSYIKLLNDNYFGWIKSDKFSVIPKRSHRIINLRTLVNNKADIKAHCISYLPMGSQIKVSKFYKDWVQILFHKKDKTISGFIQKKHIVPIKNKKLDWVKYAEQMVGTPYKWGGRDTMGIDCSALVQLSLQTAGVKYPRDTSDQVKFSQQREIILKNCKRGSIVFWKGHVGVFINEKSIIHANAFHLNTTIEDFYVVNRRIKKTYGDAIKFFDILI